MNEMTGWNVLADAVKIGLPLLLGGLVTLFTLRAARKHTERIERRKRIHEALESLARSVSRWHDASLDHYLFCDDEYFKKIEKTLDWAQRNLATLKRTQRHMADIHELRSLLLVLIGFDLSKELSDFLAAHNAVIHAFSGEGKTKEEIEALKDKAQDAYRTLLQIIRAAHRVV